MCLYSSDVIDNVKGRTQQSMLLHLQELRFEMQKLFEELKMIKS